MHNNAIESYLKSVRKNKLLTHNEEIELAKRIEKGDIKARNIMIESNLRLAISVAKKYAKYGSDLEDLIQESNLGLIKAIEKFDWRKGYKFSTYAIWWIRQSATRRLTNDSTLLKIPSHTLANARKVWQIFKEYKEEFNIEPSFEEISEVSGIDIEHVKLAIESIKTKNLISIDKPVSEENDKSLSDIIPDESKSIEDILDNHMIKENILLAFKNLTKREEIVLRLRFGIKEVLDNDTNVYEIGEE